MARGYSVSVHSPFPIERSSYETVGTLQQNG